ncbi:MULTISPECIES: TonB-dependent receptor domain-containing protein [unclassified Cellulophaga]|uniref:TonB-dependent receptor domain-containing protein n=1 Tax=unclassified Cellulophaga TaxID=2634405 RepID=UPI0026E13A8C|nr:MULTISPECIES: TonB-dependent receptor [unclassified Cellulophaga]MDO6491592.1 TonB-dependent receptor [Cellulophaga sp. 2_MG-2023]MDO6493469.1 TonB-dependent receptor [Cellulophaga sp. 3_MG-2023]
MKKYIILFLILFFSFTIYSQQKETLITIQFKDSPIKDVLSKIENSYNFNFYFSNNWFSNGKVSGIYKDEKLTTILEDIFKNTDLNYFVDKTNVYVLQNRIVYNELPKIFSAPVNDTTSTKEKKNNTITPVFYNKKSNDLGNSFIETLRIGKSTINDTKSTFILSGYIKQHLNNEPIPNVTIYVKNRNLGVSTNNNGFYEIKLPKGENLIEVSSIGVKAQVKRVFLFNNGQLNFSLKEDIEQLDEIIVDGAQDVNVEETLMGTSEIDSEESKNIPLVLGERNILKVATTLPGITTAGEGATGFNVRGGKTDQNLILLDDAVIYNPSHFFGIFQALNPFTTKSLKVYKGSIPSEFGGRLSSVFDIKSKDGNVDNFAGEASIGPITNNIALELPIVKGKSSLMVGGRSTYSDWVLKSLDDDDLKKSKANFYDVIAKYNHKINDKNDIRATAYYSKDVFSITSDSLYSYNNAVFSLSWDNQLSDKNVGNLSLFNTHYGFNIDYDGDTNTDFAFDYGIVETGFKYKITYLYNSKHKINYGITSKLYNVTPGNKEPLGDESDVQKINLDKEKGLESALFLSDDFEFNDKLMFNLGVRYSTFTTLGENTTRVYKEGEPKNDETVEEILNFDKNEEVKTYGGLEARVAARYLLKDNLSIKASYNKMYQYIHTLSNNTTGSPIDTWKLSDYNIKPQKAEQFALGIYKNIAGNDYEISLEGYYKLSNNVPDFKTGAQLTLNENIETEILQGKGKAYGVEFLVRKNAGDVNGWLSYTYSKSFLKLNSEFSEEQVNNGDYFPSNYDKPHNLNLVSNFKITRRFSFSGNFTYQTGRPVTYPIGNFTYQGSDYPIYSDRNKFRIPDYYRLDLSFNVEGNHKLKKLGHSFWNISIYNVLGRNNPYSVYFVTENNEVKAYKSSIFSIPIPTITYNIKF